MTAICFKTNYFGEYSYLAGWNILLGTTQFITCLSDQIPNSEFKNPEFITQNLLFIFGVI